MARPRSVATLALVVTALIAAGVGCSGGGTAPEPTTTLDVGGVQIEAASGLTRVAIASPSTSRIAFTALYGARIVRAAQVGRGLIAYSSTAGAAGATDIFTLPPEGGTPTRLTGNASYEDCPRWSPDGTKIAFESTRDGNREIYVMNADGSGQTRLTNALGADSTAAWSPDGAKIAFVSERTGFPDIWVMNADGSGQTDVTNTPGVYEREPSWSPDGRRIAFAGLVATYQIYTMLADGTGRAAITDNAAQNITPAWSPDGGTIAYASSQNGTYDIWLMDADGSSPYTITSGSAADAWPQWSSDGARIVFQRDHGNGYDAWICDATGGNATNITNDARGDDATPSSCPGTRIVRALIGATGTDGGKSPVLGASRPFLLLGFTDRALTTAVSVTSPPTLWNTITASALTGTGTRLVAVQIEGSQLDNIVEDRGRGLAPRVWSTPGSPATKSIVVFVSAETGAITTVLGSGATAYAASASAPSPRLEGETIVVEGRFSTVCTAADPAGDATPDGARRVVLDAATGEVLAVED